MCFFLNTQQHGKDVNEKKRKQGLIADLISRMGAFGGERESSSRYSHDNPTTGITKTP